MPWMAHEVGQGIRDAVREDGDRTRERIGGVAKAFDRVRAGMDRIGAGMDRIGAGIEDVSRDNRDLFRQAIESRDAILGERGAMPEGQNPCRRGPASAARRAAFVGAPAAKACTNARGRLSGMGQEGVGAGGASPAPAWPAEKAGAAFGGEAGRGRDIPENSAGCEAGAPAAGGPVAITVNREAYRAARADMTAREIKAAAGAPIHHILVLVAGDSGGDDEPQADADVIRLADGMRFRTVNSATFGSQDAQEAPPLLLDHVGELRRRGHKVEVTAGDAIYVVIKDYPIPAKIWSRGSSDLLIVAHDTYPNAPLDMFWLDPPISRRSGGAAPEGAGTETRNGREWQSFSWHIGGWSPAHDNLVTYLDVVDDRLRRDR